MLDQLQRSFRRAQARRVPWEPLWRDCYAHALPQRGGGFAPAGRNAMRDAQELFDGTAPDAAEQLAASLLAELMPPWSQWFGLRPGRDVKPENAPLVAEQLEAAAERIRGHFDRSNFSVEMHQSLLDLVATGTATLMFAEAPVGAASAFDFHAVPAAEMFLDGDHNGRVRQQFRRTALTAGMLHQMFPRAELPAAMLETAPGQQERAFETVEALIGEAAGCAYTAYLPEADGVGGEPLLLGSGRFERSPLVTFRWLKAAGELYGRSPVMTALPDIKTANKVVELVLKNASFAVTGVWLAEDDGVLNIANIQLTPGTIIPKAVGSAGLVPLQAPGRFDISQLVLDDLRARIRHSLLVDRLGPIADSRMTATEVLERGAETARLLGAAFGRLQAELITPLIERAAAILQRRGEISTFAIDGRQVEIEYKSPLARAQAREDVQNTLLWLDAVQKLGAEAAAVADHRAAALWLARTLGVPTELVRQDAPQEPLLLAAQLLAGRP